MNKVRAKGILRHMLHGEYRAAIGLEFSSAIDASSALKTLGPDWVIGKGLPNSLMWIGGSDKLEGVKERFNEWGLTIVPCCWKHCKSKCKYAPIDSIAHSVDYGPWFYVEIPTEDPNQETLFGKEV